MAKSISLIGTQSSMVPIKHTTTYKVMLDTHQYTKKPAGYEAGVITNRMNTAPTAIVTAEQLMCCIAAGCTVSARIPFLKDAPFIEQQLFFLDFDNGQTVNGKFQAFREWEYVVHAADRTLQAGFISPKAVLKQCYDLGLPVLGWYYSLGYKPKSNCKFRVIIAAPVPFTDETDADNFLQALLYTFPQADQSCKNLNRLFFGAHPPIDGNPCVFMPPRKE